MTPRGYAWIENVGHPSRCAWARRLLLEDFLDLAEFLLELTADFFDLAFGFEAGLVQDATDFLFDRALHFVECAFGFVSCASIHAVPRFVGAKCDWCGLRTSARFVVHGISARA